MPESFKRLGIAITDCEGNKKSLREIMKELSELHGFPLELEPESLLLIELESESSVPKVFYKGEEVTSKVHISFDWDTDTDVMGGLSYAIEHRETGSYPVTNRIERRVKGHSFN